MPLPLAFQVSTSSSIPVASPPAVNSVQIETSPDGWAAKDEGAVSTSIGARSAMMPARRSGIRCRLWFTTLEPPCRHHGSQPATNAHRRYLISTFPLSLAHAVELASAYSPMIGLSATASE